MVSIDKGIDNQKAGYSRKNLLIRNLFIPVAISPYKLDGITNPLTIKKRTTPILPKFEKSAIENAQLPLRVILQKTSETCCHSTKIAAIARIESI
jgi:hypothetical protein